MVFFKKLWLYLEHQFLQLRILFSCSEALVSVPGGELGPTLKMKRHVVLEKNHMAVERFYA